MQRVLTAEQMRLADKYTIEELGVDQEVLVERAGKAVAEEIIKKFKGGRVLVCVGNGNNGADGRVVADILSKTHGFSVCVINVSNGIFKLFDKKFDIIVDCIFGTGLNREIDGKYKIAIEKINSSGAFVVACDIPSGINGDNGKVMGVAVKANMTVAIQELKLGHFLGDGIDYSGKVIVKDIGISVWEDDVVNRLTDTNLKNYFPDRKRNSHKGCFGRSVLIGGSKSFSGSVVLSMNALTALKTGAGYSTLVVPECLFSVLCAVNPECILNSVKDDGEFICFDKESLEKYLSADCITIGMGMGVSQSVYDTICYFIENYKGFLVIDADGLNALSKYGVSVLKRKKSQIVLTPHVAEFSRLSGIDKKEILDNPIEFAKNFALEYDLVVLLKNAVSIITDGRQVFINTTGCSGMAKAGSGDVLSGIICGIMTRCENVCEGVAVSAFVFGKAGEQARNKQNDYTITASDVINELPNVINSVKT